MLVEVAKKDVASLLVELKGKVASGTVNTPEAAARIALALKEEEARKAAAAESFFSDAKFAPTRQMSAGGAGAARDVAPFGMDPADAQRGTGGGVPKAVVQKTYEEMISAEPGELPELMAVDDLRLLKEAHRLHDGLVFCAQHVKGFDPRGRREWKSYQALCKHLVSKILTTQSGGASTGTGGDFIPDLLSGTLISLVRQRLLVASSIPQFAMPTSPFSFPLEGADVNPYFLAESTSDDVATTANQIGSRTPATSKVTFTAKALKVRGMISTESDEDSILSTVDYMRMKLVQSLAEGIEDTLINGDSTSAFHDTGWDTNDHRKAWDGLRILTNSAAKFNRGNTVLTSLAFVSIFNQQGKFAQNPEETSIIVSPTGMAQLLGDSNVLTIEKLGPRASLLAGQHGALFGRPIVVSGKVRTDLNASGDFDNVTTTRSIALAFHRPSFMLGTRRGVTVESAKDIYTDRWAVVVTWRGIFKSVQAESALNRLVGILYNLSTSASF